LTPGRSTTSSINAPLRTPSNGASDTPLVSTPRRPCSPINLDSSEDDCQINDSTASTPTTSFTPRPSMLYRLQQAATPSSSPCLPLHPQTLGRSSVVACLKRLASRPSTKNVLKTVDYATVPHFHVDFLPFVYDGDVI
jgi:hypothetical protein